MSSKAESDAASPPDRPLAGGGGRPPRPKRFYRLAEAVEGPDGFALVLDGRPARTPAKHVLAVPDRPVAEALAAEWNRQTDEIDPLTMPVTRLVNSALDGVTSRESAVIDDIARYGGCDLLCYRADAPARLVSRQQELWDPLLDWADKALGARLVTAPGVVYARQPPEALAAIRTAIADKASPLALAGLHAMTTLTGSVLLALAVAEGRLSVAEAWAAAHIDEDAQAEIWGRDSEAELRRANRFAEMEAAALLARNAGIGPDRSA